MKRSNNLKVMWHRGNASIRPVRPHTWFVLGVRGSTKSSLLEHVGEGYLHEGHKVLDLFGSRDGESLAWLRSRWAKEKKILLLTGDNVDVQAPCETRRVSQLRLKDFEENDIVISSSPLYSHVDREYDAVNQIIEILYKRLHYKRLIYCIVRESANLYYSRLRVSPNQLIAKTGTTYIIREARHMGISMGLDTLKWTSVDLDIRVVIDFLFLTSQGALGLPKDLDWLYKYFKPWKIRNMPKGCFIIMGQKGPLGVGRFPKLEWHKEEQEDILRSVGVKVQSIGEELKYPQSKGNFNTVGDEEHIRIVGEYVEGLSMHKVAKLLKRSGKTIHSHINDHNNCVLRSGFCASCERGKGEHAKVNIARVVKVHA